MANDLLLIVDDEHIFRRVTAKILREHGYEIVEAGDGEEALRKASEQVPSLVVTDVMMPRLDGWQLVQILRSRPAFATVPVIMLTGLDSREDRLRGFRLGADDYLPKPTNAAELEVRIAAALERSARLVNTVSSQLAKPPEDDTAQLTGALDQIGLPSVLTILEMESKTGELHLEKVAGGRRAQMQVRDGRLVGLRVDEMEQATSLEAMGALLTWSGGRFRFVPGPVDDRDEIGCTTTSFLMQAVQVSDEERRLADTILDAELYA